MTINNYNDPARDIPCRTELCTDASTTIFWSKHLSRWYSEVNGRKRLFSNSLIGGLDMKMRKFIVEIQKDGTMKWAEGGEETESQKDA